MYGENTKYNSNPYIQGTTVPCDELGWLYVMGALFLRNLHVCIYWTRTFYLVTGTNKINTDTLVAKGLM